MLEFPHPYNLLRARLFPGPVCYNGLLSPVGFLVVARQGSSVRANGAGSSPFLFFFLLLAFSLAVASNFLEWVPHLYVVVYP